MGQTAAMRPGFQVAGDKPHLYIYMGRLKVFPPVAWSLPPLLHPIPQFHSLTCCISIDPVIFKAKIHYVALALMTPSRLAHLDFLPSASAEEVSNPPVDQ